MNLGAIFTIKDLLDIKWQITFLAFNIVLSIGLYKGLDHLNLEAGRDLRNKQSIFQRARSSVELIEEEEAIIIQYIDEYKQIAAEGIAEEEDRLQFLESMGIIRERLNLFPISIYIDEQFNEKLEYPQDIETPGKPIGLGSSKINLNVPLLHEEDFTRLLEALNDSPGLYQVTGCKLTLKNVNATKFRTLQQNLSATCEVLWYTYNLKLSEENQPIILGGGY